MERNKELDIIKGIACILMIFAHAKTIGTTIDNTLTNYLWKMGFFAPVIFFASIGVSLDLQIRKRSIYEILIFNLVFLGTSFLVASDYLFFSLAFCTFLASVLINKNGLLIVMLPILLNVVLSKFYPLNNLVHGQVFAVIPWVSFILVGNYLYKNKYRVLPAFLLSTAISIFLMAYKQESIYSQDATPLFISIGIASYSFLIMLTRLFCKMNFVSFYKTLVIFSKNSLFFYSLHIFFLFQLSIKLFAPYIWLLTFIFSLIAIYLLRRLNDSTFANCASSVYFWICFFILVIFQKIYHMPYLSLVLWGVFTLNYHNIYDLVRRLIFTTESVLVEKLKFRGA